MARVESKRREGEEDFGERGKRHHQVCGTLLQQPKETNLPLEIKSKGFSAFLLKLFITATGPRELNKDTGTDLPTFYLCVEMLTLDHLLNRITSSPLRRRGVRKWQ